jgi:APA family basic amino acid/polyamine antiporter
MIRDAWIYDSAENYMSELKKQLGLMDVFAVSAGAMISSGLFILPALAYHKSGPAVILAYFFASLLIVPSMFSQSELATAMPKAGGIYFFIERSLGSVWGLFSGFAGWFSLALKSAFAVLGLAVLVEFVLVECCGEQVNFSQWHIKAIAVLCCFLFGLLNAVSVKKTSRFQGLFVIGLLGILLLFVVLGFGKTNVSHYGLSADDVEAGTHFLRYGWGAVFATAGLVFISFGGLTKIASIAEEVKDPGRNIPLGMFLAWFIVTLFYLIVVAITVGILGEGVYGDKELSLPISEAAEHFMGPIGFILLGFAAMFAFVTTANGGILAASRSPLAMSRDQLLPKYLSRVHRKFRTPLRSIILTCSFMAVAIVFLDLETLVKAASTLMIILFMLGHISVIIMRESKIQSYRPRFKCPLYPWMNIAAILLYGFLIIQMGDPSLMISLIFILISIGWYVLYVRQRVSRASAVMHIVERVTDKQLQTVTLENELRDILIDRDEIIEDRFDKLVRHCEIIDVDGKVQRDDFFRELSVMLEGKLGVNEYVLLEKFLHREEQASTIVEPGLAIPHIILEGEHTFDIVLVRAKEGIEFEGVDEPVKIMFVLVGSKDERNYHLRALMAIAQITQEKDFRQRWLSARDTQTLRNLILLSARKRDS